MRYSFTWRAEKVLYARTISGKPWCLIDVGDSPDSYGIIILQDNNAVDVIGHDDECIQGNMRVMIWQVKPGIQHNFSGWIKSHFNIYDLPKKKFPLIGNNRYEIRAW